MIRTAFKKKCILGMQQVLRRNKDRVKNPLHSCASLQVLLDLCCVFAVKTLGLLVELGVPLVDVVDVCVVVVGPAPAVLGPLLDPTIAN